VTAGNFSFEEIPPGNYILEAKSGSEPPLVSWQVLAVGSGDLDRVVVELKPGIELTGNVIVEGSRPNLWPQITLTPEEGLNHPTDFAMVDENGRFVITGLEPAPYRVSVGRPSGPMFVKSVRFNGREVGNEVIDLASVRTVSLEIVISDRVSTIGGIITDTNGPVGAGMLVLAMNKARGDIRMIQTDINGGFSFAVMPPGDYLLVAIDAGGGFPRPAPEVFLKLGRPVTLQEGAAATVDVPLSGIDAVRVDSR